MARRGRPPSTRFSTIARGSVLMPCATTPAPTEDGRPKPRTARGKTPKDAEDRWFQVMLQDAHGMLHLPTPEIKEQLHGIPAGYTAGAGADAKTRHRMLGVAGFLRLLAMVVWSACGRSLWPPFPDRHHRRPLPTLDWLTAAWRTHGWDFSPPPPPPVRRRASEDDHWRAESSSPTLWRRHPGSTGPRGRVGIPAAMAP